MLVCGSDSLNSWRAVPVGPKHQAPCPYTLKLQLSMALQAQVPGHRAIGLTTCRTNTSKQRLLALQAQVADIGLMGCPTKKDGKAVEGVRIFLGGSIGENAQLASEFEKASLSTAESLKGEGTSAPAPTLMLCCYLLPLLRPEADFR